MEKSALQLLRGHWHLSASCRAAPDTGELKIPQKVTQKARGTGAEDSET